MDKKLTLGRRAQSLTGGYVRDRTTEVREVYIGWRIMEHNQRDTATPTPLSCEMRCEIGSQRRT
jgi:hypothetical protein